MKSIKAAFCILTLLATFAVAGPVSHFGRLKTCTVNTNNINKGRICGELTGNTPIMVKGPSLFWSAGKGTTFYDRKTVDWFVDHMEIGVIRAAMAIKYYGENTNGISPWDPPNPSTCTSCFGYLSSPANFPTAKADQRAYVQAIIDAAVANDIYVIVDWHSHNAGNEQSEAVAFFKAMAEANPNVPNIIWELYNEPVSDNSTAIRTYSNAVISAIRGTGNENLIIVGSRFYSQNPQEQASAGVTDSKSNTAYAFHFYSNEHSYSANSGIGGSANDAMNAGHAVFATEWGSVKASGGGEAGNYSNWITFMDDNHISGCYWNASDINDVVNGTQQTSHIFKAGTGLNDLLASTSANFTNLLSPSGVIFNTNYMSTPTKKWTSYIPSADPKGRDLNISLAESASRTFSSTDLGLSGTVKGATLLYGTGDVSFTSNSVTYQSLPWESDNQAYIQYTITNGTKDVKRRIIVNITDFKPILPKQDAKTVSRKAPTYFRLTDLGIPSATQRSFTVASSATGGATVEILGANGDTLKFTPPANVSTTAENVSFELTYVVSVRGNASLTSTQTITLNTSPNMRPTVSSNTLCCSRPNDASFDLSMRQLGARDADNDSIWLVAFHLPNGYPGTLEKIAPDTLRYTPASNRTGTIRIAYVVTDGIVESPIGIVRVSLTGSGTAITDPAPGLDINNPTIPGYTPTPVAKQAYYGSVSLQKFGNGKLLVNLERSGFASLNVYSISGAKVATLMNGHANAGNHEFNLAHLKQGIYIVRLKQGSEVKTLRLAW